MKKPAYGIVALAAIAVLAGCVIWNYDRLYYEYRMLPVRHEIRAGEMGWADRAVELLKEIEADTDSPQQLAAFLLAEEDPDLLAYGILLAMRYEYEGIDTVLAAHANDGRTSWHLSYISDIVRDMQQIQAARTAGNFTEDDLKLLDRWEMPREPINR